MNKTKILKSSVVLLSALLIVVWLFSPLFKNINHVYFANGGDGAKDYYTMVYHVKYDSTYLHCGAMNYPYGENIFFSGAQPFLSNAIKFVSRNIVDISDYTIAIHNLSILLTIPITALIIYLIFQFFSIPFLLSFFASLAITFSSPQLNRMGGHFSLSYTFFLPLLIYLLLIFYKKRSYYFSLFICLLFIITSFTHGYFFAFFAVIILSFWIFEIGVNKISLKDYKVLIHLFLQLLLPIIIFQLVTSGVDNIADRTNNPLGFLFYRAYPETVFVAHDRPYWLFINKIMTFTHIEWEGVAYVGLISAIGFIVLAVGIFKNLFKRRWQELIQITDSSILNMFFWSSLLLLLFSFGIPFIIKLEFVVDYLGPIRQFRSIGRFTWYFYYIINIVVVYKIWKWVNYRKAYIKYFSLAVVLSIFLYDAWFNCRSDLYYLNNSLPEFDKAVHAKTANSQCSEYQAIMPLPYFSIGSENISVIPSQNIVLESYSLSLQTRLPLNAVMMSRTSIGQCNNNIQLIKEPYRNYKVLNDIRSNKPLLLLVDKANISPNDASNALIAAALLKDTSNGFCLMELPIEKLRALPEIKREQSLKDNDGNVISKNPRFVYINFDSLSSPKLYLGQGALEVDFSNYFSLYNGVLPPSDTLAYICSFWIYGALGDVVPRATIEVGLMDSTRTYYNVENRNLGNSLVVFDDQWALVEFEVKPNSINDQLSIVFHPLRLNKEVFIDELLIRPVNMTQLRNVNIGVVKNNRLYKRNK